MDARIVMVCFTLWKFIVLDHKKKELDIIVQIEVLRQKFWFGSILPAPELAKLFEEMLYNKKPTKC